MLVPLICVSVALNAKHHSVSPFTNDHTTLPLEHFLTHHFVRNIDESTHPTLALQQSVHHGQNIRLDERTLSIHGHSTTVIHSSDMLVHNLNNKNHTLSEDRTNFSPIFLVRNSTLSLTDLTLIASARGSIIAHVSSSEVTISRSDISSNGLECPFLVDGDSTGGSCHLLFEEVFHRSQHTYLLRPLASSSSFGHQLSSAMPTIATQLKLEGVGLSISDCEIHQSTGPLFDFGTLDNRTGQRNFECVVGLSDCTLRNLTTPNHPQLIDHSSKMEQKVVNCELSWSFGNIWGAISCGLETAGSFFGMNSSFSNIQPSPLLSAPHSPPAPSTSISDSSAHDELTCDELRLISCGFWKIEGTDALIHLNTTPSSSSRTVTLNDCSFCECGCCEGSAPTLLLNGIDSVGLFDVSFVKCGGFDGSSIVVIENSFVDSTSSVHFVESGSSELCLTDLVNVAEVGLIGDTNSPSPSPFLSPIPRTLHNGISNQYASINISPTIDGMTDYFILIFDSYQLTDYSFTIELRGSVNSEFRTVYLNHAGFCELRVNYSPEGNFMASEDVDVILQEPVPGGHQIEFFPSQFVVPTLFVVLPQMDLSLYSTSPDQATVELSFAFRDVNSGKYVITLVNHASPYDEWTLTFDVESIETVLITAVLYQPDSDEVNLNWGGWYIPSRVTDEFGYDVYLPMYGEVNIPPEPARIEGIESRSFSDKTVLTLKGRVFTGDIQFSLNPVAASSSSRNAIEYSFTAEVTDSNTATCTVPAVEASLANSDTAVVFGTEYSIAASIIVNSGLTHTISPPVSAISIDPQVSENGVECTLVVTGSGFIEGEHFILVLAESSESSDSNADPITHEFEIVMRSSTEGESATIELGSEDSLQFDTTYTIVKLHLSSDVELSAKTPPTLTTPSEPSLLVNAIFVDGGIATESNPCGTIASPCQTVDRALQIIKDALFVDMEILVTGSPVLSQTFEMGSGMTLVIERATKFTETIKIPTDAISSSPLVVLSGGRFKLDHLSFVIDCTSSSLCLFSTTNTEVELENVHMTGPSNGSTPTLNEEIDEVCSWETGLMKAQGGSISASECHFSHIQQGVFSLDGSRLTVSFCKFSSNSPRSSLYRSLQWNIRCVGSGSVIVETETSETSQQESHWISTSECSVTMDGEKSLSPFVVPTLSVSDCSVSQKKSKDPLLIRIVGTKLIPCGL
ncbi:hypothetical protein BLNAU_15132 [Blattamonas nauphoetae]|uniref:Uncharacterized protein n=1 Tax=Blattamonas nauphoetae TaxID=2049346 RepID=A0ABQ9XBM8_9EUKA|nr:hypothetical protein BLNAU_15132 [Blattamonas nauphoetae]